MTYMYQNSHRECDFCKGKGYISNGQEDGRMDGREPCPGPFFKHRDFQTVYEMNVFAHDVMGLHERLMVPGCIPCNGDM